MHFFLGSTQGKFSAVVTAFSVVVMTGWVSKCCLYLNMFYAGKGHVVGNIFVFFGKVGNHSYIILSDTSQ